MSKFINIHLPGAPLTYFNDGEVRVIFLGLKFWPKVIFWGCERKKRDFFGLRNKDQGIFLGMLEKVGIFFG